MNTPAAPSLPNPHTPVEGQVIDRKYRLIRQIDEGGMGQVWVAEHVDLNAHVAIKLLRAGQKPNAAERLKREARVLARLEHPSIVRVLDAGWTDEGAPFLATELLHGETLADLLWQNKRFSGEYAVQLLLPVLEGLDVAHASGVVHRDLKPANIFLARLANGRHQPKLLDFGIASIREGIEPRATVEGVLLGSPVYMSPEQAQGLEVDARTDIWALCAVLYEMVTGSTPFGGRDPQALLHQVVQGEPRSLAEHGIEELALWAIIKGGLAKDPMNRWRDAGELGRLLAEWLVARRVTEDVARGSIQATWLASESSRPISSFPPVALGQGSNASRAPDTVHRDTKTRPTHSLAVSAHRRRPSSPSTLLWLVAGVLLGAVGALVYASTSMLPARPPGPAKVPTHVQSLPPPHFDSRIQPASPQPSASTSSRARSGSGRSSHH